LVVAATARDEIEEEAARDEIEGPEEVGSLQ
jgi:hypothetical protein